MSWFFEYHNLLPKSQFGFRRSKGCIDNLAILQSNILLSFKKNQTLLASFLDIKGAYDNVIPDILFQKLVKRGIPPNIFAFVRNSIYQRQVHCRYEDIDEILWAYKGLPQGSVLSPLLYNIYVSELENSCDSGCQIIQYADDIALFFSSDDLNHSKCILEKCVNKVSDSLLHLGLELSAEKTKFCKFIKHRAPMDRSVLSIKIKNTTIYETSKVRFLGLFLSSNLNWQHQISHVWKTCQCPLKILSCLRHTWWGADPAC